MEGCFDALYQAVVSFIVVHIYAFVVDSIIQLLRLRLEKLS